MVEKCEKSMVEDVAKWALLFENQEELKEDGESYD